MLINIFLLIKAVTRYFLIEHYNRILVYLTIIFFILGIASMSIGRFIYHDIKEFYFGVVFSLTIFICCTSIWIYRFLVFALLYTNGIAINANVEKILLFLNVPYSVDEAKKVYDALLLEGNEKVVDLGGIKLYYHYGGREYSKIFYFYKAKLKDFQFIMKNEIVIRICKRKPNRFIINQIIENEKFNSRV